MVVQLLAALVLALTWIAVATHKRAYLVPLYVVANLFVIPGATSVTLFPDVGFGGITATAPTVGDTLLGLTVLHPRVWASLRSRRLPAYLIVVALSGMSIALLRDDLPAGSVVLLAMPLIRIAIFIAVIDSVLQNVNEIQSWINALTATAAMFAGAAFIFAIGPMVGLQSLVELGRLEGADGRLSFPSLGNNKIGLAMLLITAAVGLSSRIAPCAVSSRRILLLAAVGLLTAATAELRFATAAFMVILGAWLFGGPKRVPIGLLAIPLSYAGLLYLRTIDDLPRALSILEADFAVSEDSSFNSRLDLWSAALEIWSDSPVIGELGRWEFDRPVSRGVLLGPLETHSEFLWALAAFGLLGLAASIAILWPVAIQAVKLRGVSLVAAVTCLGALALNGASFFAITAVLLAAVHATAINAKRVSSDIRPDPRDRSAPATPARGDR